MKKVCFGVLGVCMAMGFSVGTAAQEHSEAMKTPPKVLTVTREFLKPGKNGTPHDKTESAFVTAMRDAKWPSYYFGLDSLSGKLRSVFLTGYDSFDAWEKDVHAQQKNGKLAAALDRAYAEDAPLLDSVDQSVWFFREDQSHHPTTDIGTARMMELSVYRVKPGHEAEWDAIVKLVKDAYAKGVEGHWDMFQMVYGGGPAYVVITPLKDGAEIDRNWAAGKKFEEAMGAEGMRKLGELSASSIESSETNLFAINPKISYVPDDVAKSAPEFWRPKE
jgi:hypothetical protein